MARNSLMASSSFLVSGPDTNELVLDMRVTLDAYLNMLLVIGQLEERRNAASDEFLKKFSPDIASPASTEATRFDAGLQKYNEWRKTDEDDCKRITGLVDVSHKLWFSFQRSARAYPEAGAAILSLKIQWLNAYYDKQQKGTSGLKARLDELTDELNVIKAGSGPALALVAPAAPVAVAIAPPPGAGPPPPPPPPPAPAAPAAAAPAAPAVAAPAAAAPAAVALAAVAPAPAAPAAAAPAAAVGPAATASKRLKKSKKSK